MGTVFLDSDGGSDEETFESFGEHEATGDRLLQQCISQSVVNNSLILTEPYRECLRHLVVFLDLGEPADALAINPVISMQLEVHEWFWLGCGWVAQYTGNSSLRIGLDVAGSLLLAFWLGYGWAPFTCYYLIEMQNTIISLQSTMPLETHSYSENTVDVTLSF
ncbi:hypothetical protein H0E87_028634 [Populus deltoides]|uniref:Uncharacterized protein n=1 Tax=Populus deltoides TaxID=3696 RepID=A0A8T2WWB7_POPDE|nr:hypothetical protein H0E87_028631 [Populus deltoides]KAH8484264.1 hypothetical protein H0E87_028634 [Populus deltoides]